MAEWWVAAPDELLVLGGDSVSARPVEELALAVADALTADPRFAPTAAGPRDPPRRLGERRLREAFEAELRSLAGRPFRMLVAGGGSLHGWVDIFSNSDVSRSSRTHTVDISVSMANLGREEIQAFSEWAVGLFDALQVLHGFVTTSGMQAQRKTWISDATAAGRMAGPRWEDPAYTSLDRVVSDVYWVNYFGPAFVDRWGDAAIADLGVRQAIRATGAMAIWATEFPSPVEAGNERLDDYAFKAPFYAALGRRAFTLESLDVPEPGEVVPTLVEHRERTSPADAFHAGHRGSDQPGTPGQRS